MPTGSLSKHATRAIRVRVVGGRFPPRVIRVMDLQVVDGTGSEIRGRVLNDDDTFRVWSMHV